MRYLFEQLVRFGAHEWRNPSMRTRRDQEAAGRLIGRGEADPTGETETVRPVVEILVPGRGLGIPLPDPEARVPQQNIVTDEGTHGCQDVGVGTEVEDNSGVQ